MFVTLARQQSCLLGSVLSFSALKGSGMGCSPNSPPFLTYLGIRMDIRYAAGIFDGEGFVYIFKKVKRESIGYYVSVGVNMCHRPTVEAFYHRFGGHLNNGSTRKNPTHRRLFYWGAANRMAASFLEEIRPFLVVKADEADVALQLQKHIDQHRYISPGRNHMTERPNRDAILAFREGLFQQCKALKTVEFEPLLKKGPIVQ